MKTFDGRDEDGETETRDSWLETSGKRVGDLSEITSLGDVDSSAKTFNGGVEYTESETGYSRLKTGKEGVEDGTESAGFRGIGTGDRRDLSLGSDDQLRSSQILE